MPARDSSVTRRQPPVPARTPPDGGYGWVVAFAACSAQIWIVGLMKSYSLLYVAIMAAFPGTTAYHASWIPAMMTTLGMVNAPWVGALTKRYGSRKMSIIGGFVCFLAPFTSYFATSVTQLIFTLGVLTGLGAGLVTTPGILIVNEYFKKRRALASAICLSGFAIGGLVMPPLIGYFLTEYGLRGTFLITAALQLHIVVLASLYRPPVNNAEARESSTINHNKSSKPIENGTLLTSTNPLLHTDSSTNKNSDMQSKKVINLSNIKQFNMISETISTEKIKDYKNHKTGKHEVYHTNEDCMPSRSILLSENPHENQTVREPTVFCPETVDNYPYPETLTQTIQQLITKERTSEHEHIIMQSLEYPTILTSANERATLESEYSLTTNSHQLSLPVGADLGSNNSVENNQSPILYERNLSDYDDSLTCGLFDDRNVSTECKDEISSMVSEESPQNNNLGCFYKFCTCFDKEILKTRMMIAVSISSILMAIGAPHGLIFIHAYSRTMGIEFSTATTLLSTISLVDLVGRLGTGYLADLDKISINYLYCFSAALTGACALVVPLISSYTIFGVVMCTYSFGMGSWLVLIPPILVRNFGIARLPASYGFVRMLMGITNCITPQITGALIDATGGFAASYYFMGSCMLMSAFVMQIVGTLKKKDQESKEPDEVSKKVEDK